MKKFLSLGCTTKFTKTRVEDYQKEILPLWQQVNPQISQMRVVIGRLKKNDLMDAEKELKGKLIQLPLWAEEKRGTPNSILRGCLFAAIHGNQRKTYMRDIICEEEHLTIRFTGIQLDQSDMDVWEMALHMARQQNLGTDIYFSANRFLKALGRTTGKMNHEWLKDAFARLSACSVEITHGGKTYFGSLIHGGLRQDEIGSYKIEINPKMIALYQAGWTGINFDDRKKIGKRPLALWLHGYIASHAKLYPTKVETYHRLCGSDNKSIRKFKQLLKDALEHLHKLNFIQAYWFDGDMVHIENFPSPLQEKHNRLS